MSYLIERDGSADDFTAYTPAEMIATPDLAWQSMAERGVGVRALHCTAHRTGEFDCTPAERQVFRDEKHARSIDMTIDVQ